MERSFCRLILKEAKETSRNSVFRQSHYFHVIAGDKNLTREEVL